MRSKSNQSPNINNTSLPNINTVPLPYLPSTPITANNNGNLIIIPSKDAISRKPNDRSTDFLYRF